jgi:glucan-binding YG repeat protein
MGTPARYYSSTAVTTTLASSIGASDTSLQVASSSGFPSSYPFTLILEKDSANEEIVTVTALVGAAYSITRGVDGTSARAHSAGTAVEHGVSALDFTDFRSHQAAASDVHDIGATSSVVGTDTSQTLTNKTLTSPDISDPSVSGTLTNGGTISGGTVDATVLQQGGVQAVTTTDAQTLENKTLGSDLDAGSNRIINVTNPTDAQDAATKNFVETGATSQVVAATAQATAAAASATAAAASESAAATSESNAGTSESNAAASATAASASESAAATSESNAAASESNAASSATASAASATAAAASESAAATSESNAASSASAASTSETNAASSATSAANSAAAAATSLDSFDDRYLGSKASFPTLDNDGDALVQGALFYLNTGTAEQIGMYVYDGGTWIKASAASVASIVTYEYTASAGQTAFSGNDDNGVALSFSAGLLQVFLNGVLLSPGDDYTTSTNTVTLASGAALNDVLVVVAFASFNVANTYTQGQADALFATKTDLTSVEALALLGL